MAFANAHPARPDRTKFAIHKSKDRLEIHPPAPHHLTFQERLFKGLFPFRTRLLIALLILLFLVMVLWISYRLLGFNPVLILGCMLLPFLFGSVLNIPRTTHLYFDARDDRFEIRLRSIEADDRPAKLHKWDKISEIQHVQLLEHYQQNYCTNRNVVIHARQPYYLDWNLTKAEGLWVVGEIQQWLLSQRQGRDS